MSKTNRLLNQNSNSIGNIQDSLNQFGVGIRKANSASSVIIRQLSEGNKAKKEAILVRRNLFDKRREAVRRRENEDLIEAGSIQKLNQSATRKISGSTRGILGRIMGFVGTVFLGWFLRNVPDIIKKSQALIQRMNEVRLTLTQWVENTLSSLKTFTTNLMGVRTSFENVGLDATSDEQDKESKKLRSAASTMYNDFVRQIELIRDFDVIKAVKKMLGFPEEPKKSGSGDLRGKSSGGGGRGTGRFGALLPFIRSAEGGYNSIFPSENIPGLTDMSINEVVALQKEKLKDGRKSAAVGAYQILFPEKAAAKAGISLDDKFSPENQDKMGAALIEGRGITIEMIKNNPVEAALRLAREFAGIPVLAPTQGLNGPVDRGDSYYNDGVNKATVTAEQLEAAFKKVVAANAAPSINMNQQFGVGDMLDLGAPAKVTSLQGMQESFRSKPHGGIDLACEPNLFISLRVDCEVVGTRDQPDGYGLTVDVWIPSIGVQLRFAHNNRILISNGKVPAGTSFATTGSTGKSTGPHIHLEASTERGSTNYGGNLSPNPYVKLIELSKAKIEGQPGAIPDLSGYGGTSISSTAQGNTTANSVSGGKRGQVIPIPIPQASSGGGGSESGSEQGGGSTTKTITINPLNSFVAKTLLMELEYT